LLKRSVVGTYHQLSVKHLPAYLDEVAFRFNNRDNPYLFRDTLLRLIDGDTLRSRSLSTMKPLVAADDDTGTPQFVESASPLPRERRIRRHTTGARLRPSWGECSPGAHRVSHKQSGRRV
jgi:hypothetical protein